MEVNSPRKIIMKQEQIKNPDSRKNLRNRFFIVLSITLLTVFGIDRVGFSPRRVDGAIDNLIFVVSKFFPEDYFQEGGACLLYTSPSPRDVEESRMPSSA